MTCTGPGRKCNSDPILICTSLPLSTGTHTFDDDCRELAEMMCKAVVRSIEQYRVRMNHAGSPTFPSQLSKWIAWAKDPTNGLPDCLDPVIPSAVFGESMAINLATTPSSTLTYSKQTLFTFDAVQTFGADLMTFDVDNWHDW